MLCRMVSEYVRVFVYPEPQQQRKWSVRLIHISLVPTQDSVQPKLSHFGTEALHPSGILHESEILWIGMSQT